MVLVHEINASLDVGIHVCVCARDMIHGCKEGLRSPPFVLNEHTPAICIIVQA